MPCHAPIKGFRGPNGKLTQVKAHSLAGVPMTIPCGNCIGCRLDKVRDWGTRMHHEAQMHEDNCFVTLTYADEWYPDDGCVSKRDIQLFMKRLRKSLHPEKVRYYACGEYGAKKARAHYHIVLFGYSPPDGTVWREKNGNVYYRSASLEQLWGLGHVEFGPVSATNAAYVAGYVLKKFSGPNAASHYQRAHPVTGEICELSPEFALMSRNLGIEWLEKYETDCFPSDFVTVDGRRRPVPKAYQRKLKDRFEHKGSDPNRLLPVDDLKLHSQRRKKFADAHAADNVPERQAVREELAFIKQRQHSRDFDQEN